MLPSSRFTILLFCVAPLSLFCGGLSPAVQAAEFQVATFEADITIPIGHACMGGGVSDAKEIVDP